jgi:thiol-disulfide isomerase/thioredoxin
MNMRDFVQVLLDALSKWGSWLLVVLMLVPAAGLWRLWRQHQALQRKVLAWRTVKLVWWIATLAIFIWVLEVRLAPLTNSLATLQAGRGGSIPDISFRSVPDGKLHHLREFEGKVVLLNLWATYCPPCIQELPTLARLQAAYKDRGLVVLALSDEPAEKVQAFLKRHPVELMGGYIESFEWLKLEGFRPFTLVIDRQGILRKHFFGASDYEGFESHIRPYL